MKFKRHVIEIEGAEVVGYDRIKYNLGESSVGERTLSSIGLTLGDMDFPYYQDHYGVTELRKKIAEIAGAPATFEQIIVTDGATMALFMASLVMLEKGDHVVIQRPNYSVNAMMPEFIGANVEFLQCNFEDQYRFDIEKLDKIVTPKTKFVSITYPINPAGIMITEDELKRIIQICEKNDCYLISDETYRELAYNEPLPIAATLSKKAISIASASKVYGFPGIRIGWMHCQNLELMEEFLACKEQINVHGSFLNEEIALKVLQNRDEWLVQMKEKVLRRMNICKKWVDTQDYLSWNEPQGGCICFVKVDESLGIDFEKFYDYLLDTYGSYPGAGNWFEYPRNYMRIGFVWPKTDEELMLGLEGITKAVNDLRKDKIQG
ncbi:MAG: pyridoxal phosphate-dependent aminotransferase [Eubacteriales bacterium]